MKIWFCEDLADVSMSGFANAKRDAERTVYNNRGYDGPKDCIEDGWMVSAVIVELPPKIAACLLKVNDLSFC